MPVTFYCSFYLLPDTDNYCLTQVQSVVYVGGAVILTFVATIDNVVVDAPASVCVL